MKLFKRLRLKIGLFTRKELFDFSVEMVKNHTDFEYNFDDPVWNADIENFIEDLKK